MRESGPTNSDESRDGKVENPESKAKKVVRLPLHFDGTHESKTDYKPVDPIVGSQSPDIDDKTRRFLSLLPKESVPRPDFGVPKPQELLGNQGVDKLNNLDDVEPVVSDDEEDDEAEKAEVKKDANELAVRKPDKRRLMAIADMIVGKTEEIIDPSSKGDTEAPPKPEEVQEVRNGDEQDIMAYEDLEHPADEGDEILPVGAEGQVTDNSQDDEPIVSANANESVTNQPTPNNQRSTSSSLNPTSPVGGGSGLPPIVPPITPGLGGPNAPLQTPNIFMGYSGATAPNTIGPFSPNISPSAPEIDRSGAFRKLAILMGAGLLVEHMLGKSYDKKLERKFSSSVSVIEKQVKQNQQIQQRLEMAYEKHKQEIAELRAGQPEATMAAPVELQTGTSRATELQRPVQGDVIAGLPAIELGASVLPRAQGANRETTTESIKSILESQNITRHQESISESLDEAIKAELKPNTESQMSKLVLEQAAAAAENNIAVEKVYERRSEIKDDQTGVGSPQQGGAGGVMGAFLPSSQPQYANARKLAESQATINSGLDAQRQDSYKKAVKSGFSLALLLIVVGIIVYLVIS